MLAYVLKRLAWLFLSLLVLAAEVFVWVTIEDRLPVFVLATAAPMIVWGSEVFAARRLASKSADAREFKPRTLVLSCLAIWGLTMFTLVIFGIETAASLFAAHTCFNMWIGVFRDLLFEPGELDRSPPA